MMITTVALSPEITILSVSIYVAWAQWAIETSPYDVDADEIIISTEAAVVIIISDCPESG